MINKTNDNAWVWESPEEPRFFDLETTASTMMTMAHSTNTQQIESATTSGTSHEGEEEDGEEEDDGAV